MTYHRCRPYHRCPCGAEYRTAKALARHQESGDCRFVTTVRRHPARVG